MPIENQTWTSRLLQLTWAPALALAKSAARTVSGQGREAAANAAYAAVAGAPTDLAAAARKTTFTAKQVAALQGVAQAIRAVRDTPVATFSLDASNTLEIRAVGSGHRIGTERLHIPAGLEAHVIGEQYLVLVGTGKTFNPLMGGGFGAGTFAQMANRKQVTGPNPIIAFRLNDADTQSYTYALVVGGGLTYSFADSVSEVLNEVAKGLV